SQVITAGQKLTVDLNQYATDPNSPPLALSYSLTRTPPLGASLNPSSGSFTWTPPTNQAAGLVTINFTVTNAANQSTSGSFTVNVASVQPPAVQSIPTQSATIGHAFTLNIASFASDPSTPPLPLNFSLAGQPSGMSINASTGLLTWNVPSSDKIGNYSAT